MKAKAGFCLLDKDGVPVPSCSSTFQENVFRSKGSSGCGVGYSIKQEDLERSPYLIDDCFTIRCDIVVLNPTSNTSQFIDVPPSDMQRNFTNLLLSREGTDVAFRVSGETFAAHRCVLAAGSTVFRAALFGPMKEGMSSTVATMHPRLVFV